MCCRTTSVSYTHLDVYKRQAVVGDFVIPAVAPGKGLVVGCQAAVLLQAAQHRIQRGFGNIQHLLHVLRDAVAVGALPLDHSKHDPVEQGGGDGVRHGATSFLCLQ